MVNNSSRKTVLVSFITSSEIWMDLRAILDGIKKNDLNLNNGIIFVMAIDRALTWCDSNSGYVKCAYVHARWILFLMIHYPNLISSHLFKIKLHNAISRIESNCSSHNKKDRKYLNFAYSIKKTFNLSTTH